MKDAGTCRPVVLIGGFGLPPVVLVPLSRSLRSAGWSPTIAPTGLNLRCGEETVSRLESLLADAAGRSTDGVALVGHSRGGQLARVLAVRHPEVVSQLITVATPWTIGPPQRPGVDTAAAVVRAVRRRGVDVMSSIDCATGPCCERFRVDVERTPDAPWTVLWSRRDRIAHADATPPAGCTTSADIGTTHLGAVLSTRGQRAIADAGAPCIPMHNRRGQRDRRHLAVNVPQDF